MKPCLADVNVLMALLVRHHRHHETAVRWFDGLAAGEAILCRYVQLALIRLLGNRTIMAEYAVSASVAWSLIEELMGDERMEFAPEPAFVDSVLPKLFRYSVPANKLVGDAYLAAFAIAGQMRLATFDRGFEQFDAVDLEFISG